METRREYYYLVIKYLSDSTYTQCIFLEKAFRLPRHVCYIYDVYSAHTSFNFNQSVRRDIPVPSLIITLGLLHQSISSTLINSWLCPHKLTMYPDRSSRLPPLTRILLPWPRQVNYIATYQYMYRFKVDYLLL